MSIDWAVGHIIEGAGIRLEDADDHIIELAEQCKERCYYIDQAACELIRILEERGRP
jgi:hypothetical protein